MSSSFYRNIRARDLLDTFLISAIVSLLLVRLYLHITDYPQLGGGGLHIAHMLYGGLLMMVAIVITLFFLGARAREAAALIGGVGFGVFIDEVGKFITEDNDYFFRPAVGIIYAIFVILYLIFNFLTRTQKLSHKEYQINALAELEEAVAHDMDPAEKRRLQSLLESSNGDSEFSNHLIKLVDQLDTIQKGRAGRLQRIKSNLDRNYQRFWRMRSSNTFIGLLFAIEVVILAGGVFYTIITQADDVLALIDTDYSYAEELLIAQIISSLVAAGLFIYGITRLRISRLAAFEYFRRATVINIYLTQVFVFFRLQFEALPGLALNLILLILISFVLSQEARLGRRYAHHK